MKFLYDLFPLLLFYAAYKFSDIFTATAVAMVASLVQIGGYWWRHRRFETVHLVGLGVIIIFGGLTLFMHDSTYVKLVPTIAKWSFAAILLGAQFFAKKTPVEYLMGEQIALPAFVWRRINISWAIFFLLLGALNLYVAFFYGAELDAQTRERIWVDFKLWGVVGLSLVFVVIQALFMARYVQPKSQPKSPPNS